MIINKQINPERDLYYLGGKLIEVISDSSRKEYDYFDLFNDFNKSNKISLNLFSLTLDWLFVIGAIKKSNKGRIEKCF